MAHMAWGQACRPGRFQSDGNCRQRSLSDGNKVWGVFCPVAI